MPIELTDDELESLAFEGNEYDAPANGQVRYEELFTVRREARAKLVDELQRRGIRYENGERVDASAC